MQFLNFTPQETKALLFLLIALLVGSGITFYKKYHPSFAPELVFNQNPSGSSEIGSPFSPDPKDTNSLWPDTSHKISKNIITSSVSGQQKKNRSSAILENALKEKVDLNSASASQLELLPQIGPVLSQRIINYRNTKGKFQKIEDLLKVPGIGSKTFDKIKELVTVR
jgi:comEA protein